MRRGLLQDGFVAGSGFVEPRQCGEHVAALEQRVDRTAVARQHLLEREERVVEAAQARQHHGAIVKRIEIAGIERDQSVASGQRLLEPTEREQGSYQYRQCLGRPRPELDRLAQELVSFTGTALLISDEAEQMQRVELARVAREHGTIDRLRFGDPAHPMQRFSLVDGRHRKADVLISGCLGG